MKIDVEYWRRWHQHQAAKTSRGAGVASGVSATAIGAWHGVA